ncbi:hypothetical protein IEQ44_05670 [Nocardioides sp. Y6]|uniref:Secreted protein n=1 Tax=Nocardioides malaquae TaxID=2773426 RepID=A0ABR9RRD9_9ACTN|nr:hypothetical protein [Nocardioides malaquae]MBE7324133.1 hypothetical protein [Nocardioides malaquae]
MIARAVRLLVALLLVVPLTWGLSSVGASAAEGCSCETKDLKKLTKSAAIVHVGVVQASTTTDEGAEQFQVLAQRLFKGELDSARLTVTNPDGSGSCALGPVAKGERWLFLTGPDHTTTPCDGTRRLRQRDLERVQALLGVGERLPAPDPEKAVLTPVESDPPEEFTRLAAPGAAAVLLGLLGLVVVGRLNRR